MENKKTNNSNVAKVALVGAGVAALAATAYFFLGPDGKKHQKQARAWTIKMKGEVIERLEMAKEVTEPIYREIVDSVAAQYMKSKDIDQKEITALVNDLKRHWKTISGATKTKS